YIRVGWSLMLNLLFLEKLLRPLGRSMTRGLTSVSIQAKESPLTHSVTSAAPVDVPANGILTFSKSSNVVLNIAPESVTGFSKSGSDLIVQMKSGESIRIANFYTEGQPASQLFLVDRDK